MKRAQGHVSRVGLWRVQANWTHTHLPDGLWGPGPHPLDDNDIAIVQNLPFNLVHFINITFNGFRKPVNDSSVPSWGTDGSRPVGPDITA